MSSPSTRTQMSASTISKTRCTTKPLPRLGSATTRAPASRARSAVLSVEALSKTQISPWGRTRRKSCTILAMVVASL